MEPRKFIKLHLDDNNAPVVINTDIINGIVYQDDYDCTRIIFINENENIDVKESVDKIYNLIYPDGKQETKK